jgi:hypothetical protein
MDEGILISSLLIQIQNELRLMVSINLDLAEMVGDHFRFLFSKAT